MSKKILNSAELLEILDKPWATYKDIMMIGGFSESLAYKIKKEIEEQHKDVRLPKGYVPMDFVVEYLQINLNYLRKVQKTKEGR